MKEKMIALSVLMALSSGSAYAKAVGSNTLDPINGLGVPNINDYNVIDTSLSTSLTKTTSGYTLVASSTNQPISYGLVGNLSFGATGSYTLTANFSANGVFLNGSESIVGTMNPGNSLPPAVNDLLLYQLPDGEINLFSASLTKFGFNDGTSANSEYSLGFDTYFNKSWGTQGFFTGGSSGEETYLTGITYTANTLEALANAFAGGGTGLSALTAGGPYTVGSVSSITAVPLPLSGVLFGAGLTALLGFGRQNRKSAN